MKIKCFIIDDEPLAIQVLKNHLEKIPEIEIIGKFQNPLKARDYELFAQTDLLFLDIEMPVISGIDFIKSIVQPPKVIFTTAYRDYALESYELDVVDYLLKPISFPRILKAVNKYKLSTNQPHSQAAEIIQNPLPENDHLYVNVNKKFVKILFAEILYVESIKDYIRIHTSNERIVTKDKISDFELKLPNYFSRIHRSYIVNTLQITAFTTTDIEIGEREIPIGASYKKTISLMLKK